MENRKKNKEYLKLYCKKNKYRNTWTVCNQKHKHQSKKEAEYCNQLELLMKANEIITYGIQKSFILKVNNIKICKHIIDFLVYTNKNELEAYEVKGKKTKDWVIKKKLFQALYPEIKYIVI